MLEWSRSIRRSEIQRRCSERKRVAPRRRWTDNLERDPQYPRVRGPKALANQIPVAKEPVTPAALGPRRSPTVCPIPRQPLTRFLEFAREGGSLLPVAATTRRDLRRAVSRAMKEKLQSSPPADQLEHRKWAEPRNSHQIRP